MIDKCPRCGGTQGYQYTVPAKVTQVSVSWSPADEENAELYRTRDPKAVKCLDCGAWVKAGKVFEGWDHRHNDL